MFEGFIGFFGVIVGTFLTAFYVRKQERKKIATDLFVTYNSLEFISLRNSAGSILRQAFNQQVKLNWSELHIQLQENNKWEKVSAVDGFFRTLYELCSHNLVDVAMARYLFKDIHNHWYKSYFEIIDMESGKKDSTHKRLNSLLNKI
ncbi:hypothetical protein BKF98_RS23800 [Vibrio parahaemolyticus]|nr:hypothetical protein [Vibrio parahaemolyticus]